METYFAEDGSFGNATGLQVIDTSNWTEEDWELIDQATDSFRVYRAEAISKWKQLQGGKQ